MIVCAFAPFKITQGLLHKSNHFLLVIVTISSINALHFSVVNLIRKFDGVPLIRGLKLDIMKDMQVITSEIVYRLSIGTKVDDLE